VTSGLLKKGEKINNNWGNHGHEWTSVFAVQREFAVQCEKPVGKPILSRYVSMKLYAEFRLLPFTSECSFRPFLVCADFYLAIYALQPGN
jgi:hypothetical protein